MSPLSGIRRYLARQLPLAQIGALCVIVVVSLALYGRMGGVTRWGLAVPATAATVVLLFVELRLTEDVEIHYSGGERIGQLGRRRLPPSQGHATPAGRVISGDGRVLPAPRTLATAIAGLACTVTALNAPVGAAATLAALAAIAAMLLAVLLLRAALLPRLVGVLVFFELVPALILLYVYESWTDQAGAKLPAEAAIPVIGTFWLAWELWKFSRNVGTGDVERIYGLRDRGVRGMLAALMTLAALLAWRLYRTADLSPLYLAYALALAAVTAVAVVSPRRGRARPWWAGQAVPNAIAAGLVVQLLAFL